MKAAMAGRLSRGREKQTQYLTQAIQLEEAVNPHIIRATMTMISLALLAFVGWAGLTNIYEVAHTPGEVVPYGHEQTVQHLEGGIVKSILVSEGDLVEKNQLLMTLDDSGIAEDLKRALSRQLDLEMQAERLRAFVEGRTPDFSRFQGVTEAMKKDQEAYFNSTIQARAKESRIVHSQIEEKKQSIASLTADLNVARSNYAIAHDIYTRRVTLLQSGYASQMKVLEDRQNANELLGTIKRLENELTVARTEIAEYENRLESLSANNHDDAYEKLAQVEADKTQNVQIVKKLGDQRERLGIRAPVRGMVKGLNVNTVGSVVQPGQTLMDIVPLDHQLEIRVKISPQDRGHVAIGQKVQVKFSAYDFSRYGSIEGTLDRISATTFDGPGNDRYYQGRITLASDYVGGDPANLVMPGMTVMADVITGEKTILQYLLKPIQVSLQTAFRER